MAGNGFDLALISCCFGAVVHGIQVKLTGLLIERMALSESLLSGIASTRLCRPPAAQQMTRHLSGPPEGHATLTLLTHRCHRYAFNQQFTHRESVFSIVGCRQIHAMMLTQIADYVRR